MLSILAVTSIQPAQAQTGINTGVYYKLVARHSGKALDVNASSTADGANVQQWADNGQANQQWRFVDVGGGYYKLLNRNSGKALDVAGQSVADGANVQQWADNGQTNQQWRPEQVSSGVYKLVARHSGKALDVNASSTADGANVQQWADNGQANQQWQLVQADGTQPTPVVPTPSPGTCNAAPVDPQATTQARKLLCYLYSQYGNHIISGQQESTWVNGPDYEMNYIYNNTGKYPAIRGLDMGDSPTFGTRALAWWNAGGIPMVGYHMGSPAQDSDGYSGSQMKANINAALTSGTADNRRLLQRLDAVAAQLKIVQDGGGAVLWRPYHEAGGTWFWWSMEGGSQYVRLWRYTFDYLTKTKGLHNLVWLHPYSGSPDGSFYPGKAYVDVGGADTYAGDHGPLTSMFNTTRNIVGTTIPIALHENGPIPDPDQLQSSSAKWVLFNTWHTTWITNTSTNPISLLQKVYGHAYVVTRDEVPNLK
jgi:hypothetical protein